MADGRECARRRVALIFSYVVTRGLYNYPCYNIFIIWIKFMQQKLTRTDTQLLVISTFLYVLLITLSYTHNVFFEVSNYRDFYFPNIVFWLFLLVLGSTLGNLLMVVVSIFSRKWIKSFAFFIASFIGIVSIIISHLYDSASILHAT